MFLQYLHLELVVMYVSLLERSSMRTEIVPALLPTQHLAQGQHKRGTR